MSQVMYENQILPQSACLILSSHGHENSRTMLDKHSFSVSRKLPSGADRDVATEVCGGDDTPKSCGSVLYSADSPFL